MIKGALFIVTAPSGAGKTTICDAVMSRIDHLQYSISATTRQPRKGEKDGEDYFFLSRDDFEKGIKEDRFLEYAEVYGNYYGTPKDFVFKQLQNGRDIILDIDVQGALELRKKNLPAVFVFIVPPSLEELKRRLENRGTDSPEVIAGRFSQARKEMGFISRYDYCIINDDLDRAIEDMIAVIRADRCRVPRLKEEVARISD